MAVSVPVLETERLILRPHRQADFETYAAFYAHPTAAQFIGGTRPRSEAWRSLAYIIGHWPLRGFGMFALESKATGAYVGRCGPYFPEGWPEPEFGWTLMLGQTGKGYATEAAIRARQWAYETLGWTTAISLIDKDNASSIRLAERLGAVYEGEYDPGFGMMNVYRHPGPEVVLQ